MKVVTATLLAALVATSCADFDEAANRVAGEVIEGEYIAMAKLEPVKCDELRRIVDKAKADTDGMDRAMLDGPARENKIFDECFITFKGSEAFKKVVEDMDLVEEVEANGVLEKLGPVGSWGQDRVDQPNLPLNSDMTSIYKGAGQRVYVLDTGINKDHVDFGNRAQYGVEYVNEGTRADRNGHGTHCAGTIAGSTYGVAPEATVIGVKVLSGSGSGSFQGILDGVDWVVRASGNTPVVLSMSLGGGYSASVNRAVQAADTAGNIVVVAAGNENQDACNVSPASAGGNVVTVGSTDRNDRRSSFSNWGSCVDIFAPGSSITSTWIGSTRATNTISGTSMATPHVAGAAALFLEKYGNKGQALSALLNTFPATNKISDVRGTVNKLLQIPKTGGTAPTPPTPTPPTPTPPTPPPSCWWCWWLDSAETGAQSPAPAPAPEVVAAPAVDNSSDVLTAAVISGSTVAFVALAAGMVVYKRNKSRETAAAGGAIEDQL